VPGYLPTPGRGSLSSSYTIEAIRVSDKKEMIVYHASTVLLGEGGAPKNIGLKSLRRALSWLFPPQEKSFD